MNDYIKREDALSEMAKAECGLGYEECNDCSCSYIGRIRDIPSADVRENVKGEWIDCGIHGDWAWEQDGHGNFWHIWKCSKCEHTTEHCSNYCPNCGAEMGEVKHEEK